MKIPVCILLLGAMLLHAEAGSQTAETSSPEVFHEVNLELLDLFREHPIVAIGEGQHNSALTFEWLSTFIRMEAFADLVDNIMVEFGASEYQPVMDDYTRGKEIPDSLLSLCWRETTQILVWDAPIYRNFFREIREINQGLPEERKIRILLGDPSFGSEEHRDAHAFRILEQEVLAKGETALLLFGDLHLVRRDVFTNYAAPESMSESLMNVIQFLETRYPGKAYCIWGSINTQDQLTREILAREKITIPSFLPVTATALGDIDFRTFYPYPTDDRTDGHDMDIPVSDHVQMPMKDIVDGILFRGNWEAQNRLAPRPDDLYADATYLDELIRREMILNIPPYRTRLHYYRISGREEFARFEHALENELDGIIDTLYQPIKDQIPPEIHTDLLYFMGRQYLRNDEPGKAIAALQLARRENPESFRLHQLLGDAYLANNEMENARHHYQEALKRDPDNLSLREKFEGTRTK